MSFTADLTVPGADYLEVSEVEWHIAQRTDARHVPVGGVYVGEIELTLARLTHPVLAEWMANAHKTLNGRVRLFRPDGLGVTRTLDFEEAYCFQKELCFRSDGRAASSGMTILVAARTLRVDGALVLTNGERPR